MPENRVLNYEVNFASPRVTQFMSLLNGSDIDYETDEEAIQLMVDIFTFGCIMGFSFTDDPDDIKGIAQTVINAIPESLVKVMQRSSGGE